MTRQFYLPGYGLLSSIDARDFYVPEFGVVGASSGGGIGGGGGTAQPVMFILT